MGEIRFEIWRGDQCFLSTPIVHIPKGARPRECYETEKEIIVCGQPDQDDKQHNCDALGCSSVSHVLFRFPKEPIEKCDHNWVSARNEVVTSGEVCLKCNSIREENSNANI